MAEPVCYAGPNAMIVRWLPALTDDADFADPAVALGETALTSGMFWGVPPHRSGLIGPLKQLLLQFVFLDNSEDEVAGVTFSFYTFNITLRNQLGFSKKGTGGADRPFVRKTGAGVLYPAGEVMTVDVNKTEHMGIRLFTYGSLGAATHGFITAQEAEYR